MRPSGKFLALLAGSTVLHEGKESKTLKFVGTGRVPPASVSLWGRSFFVQEYWILQEHGEGPHPFKLLTRRKARNLFNLGVVFSVHC